MALTGYAIIKSITKLTPRYCHRFPYASRKTQRFVAKKGPRVKDKSLNIFAPKPPVTRQSLRGFDNTKRIDTRSVTKTVTGIKRLKARLGYNNKVDQDIKTIPSLKILNNIKTPFDKKLYIFLVSCIVSPYLQNIIVRIHIVLDCFYEKFMLNLTTDTTFVLLRRIVP
jgi:hypothetical protein